ncbi:helix-turn-helix domain-containing protein [Dysgonomonas sp. Marseille-P4677]|uniref:helix-turn-helix domain-containing protein n=1 Tax=Dysgonomonas sp. Marseille-P4677 TaxID=2364790 RepID=UPI00351C5F74
MKLIMESEQLTPSAFADKLQLGRAVISHILNGRNNPSLDVVARILSHMKNINPDWLITGNGNMYKSSEQAVKSSTIPQASMNNYPPNQNQPDLFSQNYVSPPVAQQEPEYRKEIIVEQPVKSNEDSLNQTVVYQKLPERKISKIIIYYTDNTFETFDANNKPL